MTPLNKLSHERIVSLVIQINEKRKDKRTVFRDPDMSVERLEKALKVPKVEPSEYVGLTSLVELSVQKAFPLLVTFLSTGRLDRVVSLDHQLLIIAKCYDLYIKQMLETGYTHAVLVADAPVGNKYVRTLLDTVGVENYMEDASRHVYNNLRKLGIELMEGEE